MPKLGEALRARRPSRMSPKSTSAMRMWPCASRSTSVELVEVVGVDAARRGPRRAPRRRRGGRGEALDDGAGERVDHRLEADAAGRANSSGMSVSVAPAALPMPSARWPALRPIATTKYQREVVLASTIRFLTISTPTWRAVWKPNVSTSCGQVEVVVDGLRHVDDAEPPVRRARARLHGRERGVVAADGDELPTPSREQRRGRRSRGARVLGRVGARDAEVRAAAEVDAADVVDVERRHVVDVALHEPLEAVADAEHLDAARTRGWSRRRSRC